MSHYLSGPPLWAGFLRVLPALLLGVLLVGCQSPREALQQLADEHGRQLEILSGHPFPLAMLPPQSTTKATRLRVYLEGDGHAWATATQPSLDPSPHNLLVARLAVDDPTPNAYLARPCQFVIAPTCEPAIWTDWRFSQEVITSLSQALDQLKQRCGNREFELVGYSGGAALALLLAAQRDDVILVQTLAGNLSPRLWAELKGLSPLNGSLDPLDYRNQLVSLPQRHLVGQRDTVIPSRLPDLYRRALGSPSHIECIHIPGASHDTGWEVAWKRWVQPLTPALQPSPCVQPRLRSSEAT
ncbi:TPA: alpha/beta hydrolase [Pseudomonas aeruginosa]|uniref:alpha/beta hydrolase n=1 Tax=Pseudomonas aeruginosa TaxID=287 RepID=UPI000940FE8E|nr:alpha/beta hydrolase [Pseudomonas aeruginosa]ELK4906915.1 alpha/beta hydrolase [Pseudomonas aeruginosa]MBG6610432.1 alpha/beta hydrolase [Pseudomonas aeruginosa]MDV6785316.1 alpha/beta hydrolase [Pseudomonas aeruginosa]RTX24855.1 alpha/beta hydrolase [Pseudomonas aeruginosa]HBO5741821.1 alpha/beta hydrolase [Pseudomonas aeruginosa]